MSRPAVRVENDHRRVAVRALLPGAAKFGVTEEDLVRRSIFFTRERGQHLLLAGDRPDVVYVVGLGAVAATVPLWNDGGARGELEELIVRIAKPGELVSVDPLGTVTGATRFGARALIRSTVVGLPRELVRDVLARQPGAVRLRLAGSHARAASRALHDVCQLMFARAEQQLTLRLQEVCRAFPASDDPCSIDPRLRWSQTRMGEHVARTRAAVNRVLHRLVALGVLRPCLPDIRFSSTPPARRFPGEPPCDEPTHLAPVDDDGVHRGLAARAESALRHMGFPSSIAATLWRRAALLGFERGARIALGGDGCTTLLARGVARVDCLIDEGQAVGIGMARAGELLSVARARMVDRVPTFMVRAHERCIVARLHHDALAEALGALDVEQLLRFYIHCQATSSRRIYEKYRMLQLQADERMLYQLRILARDFQGSHPDGTIVDLDLTDCRSVAPRVLGDFIGVVPTTAAKVFGALLRQQRVAFVDGRILLPGYRHDSHESAADFVRRIEATRARQLREPVVRAQRKLQRPRGAG